MRRLVIRSILLVVLVQVTASAVQNSGTNISANSQQQLIIEKNLTSMPLAFTENRGQWDEQALFRANAGGATMWFTSTGAVYQFTRSIPGEEPQAGPVDPIHELSGRQTPSSAPDMDCEPEQYESMTIKASFVGANPNPQVVGLEEMEYKCNYFIGNDPNEWHTDVPNYTAVLYEQVYDGIDLKYYGNGKQMEYDFIVSPGADFSQIQIDYEGAESISVNISGELVVETEWGEVVEQKPVIYQMVNNTRIPVTGVYSLKDDNSFGFKMTGDFDSSLPLVIDPVLSYSTYLGGNGDDYGVSIAVDGSGSAYVTGHTNSTNFPTLNPIQATNQGAPYDVFVTKLSSSGNSLVYSTYLGGSSADWGESITIDGSGSAYVTGDTYSTDFPTLNPIQTTNHGYYDVFVTKLSSSGNSLVYSTYLGESDNDGGNSIAVDGSGSAYVTGQTFSTDFPTLNPYQTYQGDYDLFVTKLSSSGNSLVYSTYLGGNGDDYGVSIAVDGSGSAYVTGHTNSTNFPTLNPIQATNQGAPYDVFVTKLSSSGNSLVYSTYLGGSAGDVGKSIAVDSFGSAYMTGYTDSPDFPTLNPYQTYQTGDDVFVTKLSGASDIDGDGYTDDVDCDDNDPYTYPGAAPNDSPTACMRDADEDDYGDITATGDIVAGTDCDDAVASIYPGATEIPGDGIDQDCDGIDPCCIGRVGDANGLGGDEPTIGDISVMIDSKFISGTCIGILECLTEADVNQTGGPDPNCDDITIGDISILIDYLFITGSSLGLPDCL